MSDILVMLQTNSNQPFIWLIPNEGGWRGWRVGLGVGVEVFT